MTPPKCNGYMTLLVHTQCQIIWELLKQESSFFKEHLFQLPSVQRRTRSFSQSSLQSIPRMSKLKSEKHADLSIL
ncbi:hypothetical protein TNCV_2981651 [Trichonephila clavipes]|nr:hypothetical protein TNCV_2981651 [Trichonephila clavipes]